MRLINKTTRKSTKGAEQDPPLFFLEEIASGHEIFRYELKLQIRFIYASLADVSLDLNDKTTKCTTNTCKNQKFAKLKKCRKKTNTFTIVASNLESNEKT